MTAITNTTGAAVGTVGADTVVHAFGRYTMGDHDGNTMGRAEALLNAKIAAIEEAGVTVASILENVQVEHDGEFAQNTRRALWQVTAGVIKMRDEDVVCRFSDTPAGTRTWECSITATVDRELVGDRLKALSLGLDASHSVERLPTGVADWENFVARARGFGAANTQLPEDVWQRSAEEAAAVDAQSKLLELVQGLSITSRVLVQNYRIISDTKIKELNGRLERVRQVGNTRYPTATTAELVMEIDLKEIVRQKQ